MAKCLVLGANGFIGSHLVDALVGSGHSVRAFMRPGNTATQFNDNDAIEVFTGDYLNHDDIKRAVAGMDYVFHFISTTTPATAENDPLIDVETNIKTSVELFQACAEQGVKKVIFASTGGAIYGGTSGEPLAETTLPQPISPYAIGKLTIEHYLHYFKVKFDMDSVVYRISNPYGPRHPAHAKQGVINIFLGQIANQEPITILGDGGMVRDYIYITDVAQMIAQSFEAAHQAVYNLGSGHGVSINELVTNIEQTTGQEAKKQHKENPVTFINKVVLDTTRFQNEFHIEPQVDLAAGIAETWQYIKEHPPHA